MGCLRTTLVLALVAVAGCSSGPGKGPELVPLPEPDLEQMDAPVRESILELRRALSESPEDDRVRIYGELGRTYYAFGLQDAAEACFLNASRLDEDDFAPAYFLGLIELERGRLETAAQHLENVLRQEADYTAARVRLGKARIELGDAESGRNQLERALADAPYAAAAHYSLGQLAAREGDHRSAVDHFQRVLELQPQATRVHYPLGQSFRRLGDRDSAARHVEASGDRDVTFPDPLTEALRELTSGAGDLLNTSGRAFLEGMFAEAAEGYRKAIEVDPNNVEAYKGLALSLAKLGNVEGAEEQFLAALRLHPDDPDVERGLGLLMLSRDAVEGALEHLGRAAELDPGSVDSQVALAGALHRAGQLEQALQRYDDALELDPLHRGARLDRAAALQSLGRIDEAIAGLRATLEADPEHNEARLSLGALLVGIGRSDEAEPLLEELLARDLAPSLRARALFDLGVIESTRGNQTRAQERYGEALVADPDLGEARLFYAAGLARAGRYGEAAEHLGRVVDLEPLNLRARLAEATALVLAGRHGRARDRLEEGLSRTEGQPQLVLALAKLLATCPEAAVRDGTRALALARGLFDERPTLAHAEVLAMAHAETGDFDQAVAVQRGIVARASEMGEAELVSQFAEDLARYERGEPSRAPWPGARR